MVGSAAALFGATLRVLLWCLVRCLPLVPVFLISYGIWLYDNRAAPIAAGILTFIMINANGRKR